LRGIGHLQRAAAIARGLAAGGIKVDLVSGGRPVAEIDTAGISLHQLPPVTSPDDSYTRLVDEAGREVGPAYHARRIGALLRILETARPDALLIEMFPFGRSQIAEEMTALIEAARARTPKPLILSSVRDIVAAKRSLERYEEMADQVVAWFDAVLVHGDDGLIAFGDSFPPAARIRKYLHYTGYVLPPAPRVPARASDGADGEVLVSAGGGAYGAALMRAALDARGHGALDRSLRDAPWHLLTGPNLPAAEAEALAARAGPGVAIERMRPDFRALLARARVSVSLCGYNTALEVIEAGVPAVMMPAGTGRQNEQRRRADALGRRGLVEVVAEADLSAASLAGTINRAAAKRRAQVTRARPIDLSGLDTTHRLIAAWLEGEPPERSASLASSA
jgi:predicted glycosyltransferase